MPSHPPLCPKTPERFTFDGAFWWWTVRGLDPAIKCCDETPAANRFVARYQACAWLDRAWRWERLHARLRGPYILLIETGKTATYHARAVDCFDNARAWREWERKHA